MSWKPSAIEIEGVQQLAAPKRYTYLVKRFADEEQIWNVRNSDRWVLAGDDSGRQGVPIWPHEDFARLAATDAWTGCQPEPISLEAWLARWIPGMERDNRFVAVFPTPNDKGVAVEPSAFASDLRRAVQDYQ
jgi:hypothetical protein